jgi:hypothetical protein
MKDDLKTIEQAYIQHKNGYHISQQDWKELVAAVARVNNLMGDIARKVEI